MPIGIVSDLDLNKELDSLSTPKKKVVPSVPSDALVIDIPTRGRDEGDVNVPESLRKIIGEDAVINGRQSALALAQSFGISPSSVSAYAKGATSTASYDSPKSSIVNHINKSRQRVVKRASKTLNSALSAISQEKLDYSDAKDLAGIAKDMSVIIKNMEPQQVQSDESAGSKTPQFVIYAPTFRDERSFETITVQE